MLLEKVRWEKSESTPKQGLQTTHREFYSKSDKQNRIADKVGAKKPHKKSSHALVEETNT